MEKWSDGVVELTMRDPRSQTPVWECTCPRNFVSSGYAARLADLPRARLIRRIELNRFLEMFLRQISHSDILKAQTGHPMIKRIVWSVLIRLSFMSGCSVSFSL